MRLAVLIMTTAMMAGGCAVPIPEADLILHGGKVIPLGEEIEPVHPTAVALKDGRVLFVGDDARVREYQGPGTEMIDLASSDSPPTNS